MKNRLFLIIAIYSFAGILALDVHAADDDIVGPPRAEEQEPQPSTPIDEIPEEEVKPEPKPAAKPKAVAPKPNRPNQDEGRDRIRPNRPNRPNSPPNYPKGPGVQWIKLVCPQARFDFFGFGDSVSKCYVEGTRKRYEVILDSTGFELGAGSFFIEIKHTPGSNISGYYTGDGASIGIPLPLPLGGAGGRFYQKPRKGGRPLNRATLVGAQFGLGFSKIDGITIRRSAR